MNELSEKELLNCFDEMCLLLAVHGFTKKDKRAMAIRELIQNQPPVVDEKFIMDWSRFLVSLPLRENVKNWTIEMPRQVKQMLIAAGVKVK